MKKILSAVIAVLMLGTSVAFAAPDPSDLQPENTETVSENNTQQDISVEINGQKIDFDVPPQIINDRTMVPMRKIFETLGAKVEWLGETRQILAVKGENAIVMQIDAPVILKNSFRDGNEERIELDVAPVIIDARTLVPVRAVSESLNATVQWSGDTRTVSITTN